MSLFKKHNKKENLSAEESKTVSVDEQKNENLSQDENAEVFEEPPKVEKLDLNTIKEEKVNDLVDRVMEEILKIK